MPKQPTLKRNRPQNKAENISEALVVEKGLDRINNPSDRRTKDFGTPMNLYEHELFIQVEKALKEEFTSFGGKVSRRSLARAWIVERIKEEAKSRGITEK